MPCYLLPHFSVLIEISLKKVVSSHLLPIVSLERTPVRLLFPFFTKAILVKVTDEQHVAPRANF